MKVIVNMEVAVAKCIGMPTTRVKIGTISTPPPIPNSPEAIPPRKLKIAQSSIFRKELNEALSDFVAGLPAPEVDECFSLMEFGSIDIGRATKIITKNPKKVPNSFAGITVVKYTPRIPPGAVATASNAPVL